MFNLSHYCPPGIDFLKPWFHDGIIRCFSETCFTTISAFVIIPFGLIQYILYYKHGSLYENTTKRHKCFFRVQQVSICLLIFLMLVRFLLQESFLYENQVYGYMLLVFLNGIISWFGCLLLLRQECRLSLPSIPSRGHGLVLLLFWTVSILEEFLDLISLHSDDWFWKLKNSSDQVELGLWICRVFLKLAIFLLGLYAPGLPSHYISIRSDEEQAIPTSTQRTTWSGLFSKLKRIGPYIWPKNNLLLQFYVLLCVLMLIFGRLANLFTPIYYKYIVDSLTPIVNKTATVRVKDIQMNATRPIPLWYSSVNDLGVVVASATGLVFRWDYVLIYVSLRTLQGLGGSGNGILGVVRSQLWIRVQQYTSREMGVIVFSHLHALSLRWHLSKKTGEVLRIVDRGTDSVNNLLNYILFNIAPTFIDIFIGIIYFSSSFNVWFGLIVLVTMASYLAVTIWITEWRTKYRRSMNILDNKRNAVAVDSLVNFETVKYYGAEKFESDRYRGAIVNYQGAEWLSTSSLNLLNLVQNFTINLGFLTGALLCCKYAVDGYLTVGDFVLFCTYIMQLYGPLNWFGTYYRMIQTNFIDMENMFDLLNEDKEIVDIENAPALNLQGGEIHFNDIYFHYVPERPILRGVTFHVPAGKTVAIVGHSGSGKSTVVRLLFRLYNPVAGTILLDGQDITKVQQESLRQKIGVVPQDTVLFNCDIRYNIRYGCHTASDEQVEEAARAADIHSRIESFPDGYETVVGERGLKISGGEKQRVAIARTILKAPNVILLDEATSALDTNTERMIQSSLRVICENRTTLIIAHRLSTIVHADEILVMSEGEIIERGRHEDLLAKEGGAYALMWSQQSTKDSDDGISSDDSGGHQKESK